MRSAGVEIIIVIGRAASTSSRCAHKVTHRLVVTGPRGISIAGLCMVTTLRTDMKRGLSERKKWRAYVLQVQQLLRCLPSEGKRPGFGCAQATLSYRDKLLTGRR